jgi:hypothetical protein
VRSDIAAHGVVPSQITNAFQAAAVLNIIERSHLLSSLKGHWSLWAAASDCWK